MYLSKSPGKIAAQAERTRPHLPSIRWIRHSALAACLVIMSGDTAKPPEGPQTSEGLSAMRHTDLLQRIMEEFRALDMSAAIDDSGLPPAQALTPERLLTARVIFLGDNHILDEDDRAGVGLINAMRIVRPHERPLVLIENVDSERTLTLAERERDPTAKGIHPEIPVRGWDSRALLDLWQCTNREQQEVVLRSRELLKIAVSDEYTRDAEKSNNASKEMERLSRLLQELIAHKRAIVLPLRNEHMLETIDTLRPTHPLIVVIAGFGHFTEEHAVLDFIKKHPNDVLALLHKSIAP